MINDSQLLKENHAYPDLLHMYSRCQPPAQCVPSFSNAAIVPLPTTGSTAPIRILGRCINPCPQECGSSQQDPKCGTDGRTYFNTCYRNCANVPV